MSNYNADSIKHLETREAIRTRISMYLGTDDTDGIYQALKEIINNSTDEALAGYGNTISIMLDESTNEVTVRDLGRGVPFSTKNGRNVLVEIYTQSHTGGKFDKDTYKISSGLNGIGGTAVCMSSKYFVVKTEREEGTAIATFDKGILKDYQETKEKNKITGTTVTFCPDKEVFKNMTDGFSYDKICEEIKNVAYLNKGIHFIIETNSGKKSEFYSENGIADFIMEKAKNPLMEKPIFSTAKDETDELEIAFIWTEDNTQDFVFVNGLMCPEGGSPITGAKSKITTKMKSLTKKNFSPEVIRKGLVFAINCKVLNPSFANQTKSKINNANLRTLAAQAFDEGLEHFSNTSDFAAIVEMMTKIEKAEKAANKAREAILSHNKEMNAIKKTKLAFIDKLSDAEELGENAILCVTEGNSAGASVALGRDTKIHGILRIRGKMINGLKAEEDKVLQNEEIKLLLYALGIDINHYNSKKLRYGKIAMCVDQDK